MKKIILIITILSVFCSCSSIAVRTTDPNKSKTIKYPCVFPGVRHNFSVIKGDTGHAHGRYFFVTMIAGIFVLIDFPFSLAVDTALFPYDIIKISTKASNTEQTKSTDNITQPQNNEHKE